MPTRRQDPADRSFRQDAFASSAENERGILGNLVAARCHKLTDREEIAMLWWLQQVSWRDGGLEKFAEDFLNAHGDGVGTRSMHRYGFAPGQIYSADQVREIRRELGTPKYGVGRFPLKGEYKDPDADPLELVECNRWVSREEAEAYPSSYPAALFVEACSLCAMRLAGVLKRMLVDPSEESLRRGLWNFPSLWNALLAWQRREIESAVRRIVPTTITRQISDELDFALETRSFVLIEGFEGRGKSEGALDWCNRHPGRAIYVRLEAGSDETTLYRSIARRLGTACTYQRKAVEMRARIQDALQGGHLMLVLDEAHFLWPQSGRSERAAPKRLDWLRTAIIDFDVPVALISTPQFFERQCERFRKAGWNANQIQRRLARTLVLPETVTPDDALAVAQAYFPAASEELLVEVAAIALRSVGHLSTLSHIRKRVDFLSSRTAAADEEALLEHEIAALLTAKKEPLQAPTKAIAPPGKAVAHAPQPAGRDRATSLSGSALVPANRTASPQLRPDPIMT